MSKYYVMTGAIVVSVGIALTGLSFFVQKQSVQRYSCMFSTGNGPTDELGIRTEQGKLHGFPLGYYEAAPSEGCSLVVGDEFVASQNTIRPVSLLFSFTIWSAAVLGSVLFAKRLGVKL